MLSDSVNQPIDLDAERAEAKALLQAFIDHYDRRFAKFKADQTKQTNVVNLNLVRELKLNR